MFGTGPASACSTASTHRVVVSKDALALVQAHLGGDVRLTVLFNGVETAAIRAAAPFPRTRPAIFFLGRHEERKGLGVLLAGAAHARPDVDVLGRRRRPRHRPPARSSTAATRASSGWAGSPRPTSSPASAAPRCSARRRCTASRSASCWSRRWRPARPWSPARSPATATWRPTGSTPCSSRPATPDALAAALTRVINDEDARGAPGRRPAPSGPTSSRCRSWPARYTAIYHELVARR